MLSMVQLANGDEQKKGYPAIKRLNEGVQSHFVVYGQKRGSRFRCLVSDAWLLDTLTPALGSSDGTSLDQKNR